MILKYLEYKSCKYLQRLPVTSICIQVPGSINKDRNTNSIDMTLPSMMHCERLRLFCSTVKVLQEIALNLI